MFLPGRRKPSHRPNKKNGRKNSMTLIKQRLKYPRSKIERPLGHRSTDDASTVAYCSAADRGEYRQAAGAVALDSTLQSGFLLAGACRWVTIPNIGESGPRRRVRPPCK